MTYAVSRILLPVHMADALSDAASILCVENQHQAWIASAVNKGNPWSNSWGTPLPFDGVYTILAEFITGCPGD